MLKVDTNAAYFLDTLTNPHEEATKRCFILLFTTVPYSHSSSTVFSKE